MKRDLFTPDQEDFRLLIREFIEREVVPHYAGWESLGHIPRDFFRKLGEIGVMGMAIPEKIGGSGHPDYRYNVILQDEASRALVTLGDRREGLSLLVVEDGMPGFVKGRKLEKIGLKVQDTAELSFSDVRVPVANLLGEEGKAFGYLGRNLPQERLTIAVGSVAQARAAVTAALDYAKSRLVFGKELASFQNTKFERGHEADHQQVDGTIELPAATTG